MLRLCLIDGGGFDLVVCYRSFLRLVALVVAFACGFGFVVILVGVDTWWCCLLVTC